MKWVHTWFVFETRIPLLKAQMTEMVLNFDYKKSTCSNFEF